jgi:uncharacterized protein YbjT (DUF2867 family)
MKIVVIGGRGLIGSKLVKRLREHGQEAVAASPDSRVNILTSEGLADALRGASVVVDVSNFPSFADAAVLKFFVTSTTNLLDAEAAAGVGHHVALSIVGTDRPLFLGSGYVRAKMAQETLIKAAPIPYSIVRATQFYEFVNGIADASTEGTTVRLRFDEFIRRGLAARNDSRQVVADPRARYYGAELGERTLVPGDDARLGETTFDAWLSQSTSRGQVRSGHQRDAGEPSSSATPKA